VLQEAPADYPTLRSHRVAIGLYSLRGGELVRTKRVELDVVGARTAVAELAGELQPDLILINDDDLTYAKVRLDERSLRTLVDGGITKFTESLPRALCWSAAWDMTRDAEMSTRDYLALVISGVSSIKDITVAQTVLRQARQAVQQYADPAWRRQGLTLLASALRSLVDGAEPGSDHQLAYVNALSAVATSTEDLAFVRGLLDGSTVLDGLTVDTDLRWTLVQSLVSGGVLDDEDIAGELLRDATASGERFAALSRASIPTAEAKANAWSTMIEGKLSGALLRSTILGFMDPRHPDLLEPYAAKYFEEIGSIWKSWTSDSAQNFATGCYPALSISPETVARTQELIAESQPSHALKRLLLEGADGVSRALRAQAKDAAPA
jgi:aminopeptidase N